MPKLQIINFVSFSTIFIIINYCVHSLMFLLTICEFVHKIQKNTHFNYTTPP